MHHKFIVFINFKRVKKLIQCDALLETLHRKKIEEYEYMFKYGGRKIYWDRNIFVRNSKY